MSSVAEGSSTPLDVDIASLRLSSPTVRRRTPAVNALPAHKMKHGDVVRFRGMIQDMHNPEFYFETFEVYNRATKQSRICSGKYKDASVIGENESVNYTSPHLKSAERHTFTVVSLPGLNDWVKKVESEHIQLVDGSSCVQNTSPPSTSTKRTLDCDEDDGPNKKSSTGTSNDPKPLESACISKDYLMNHPLPDENGKVCLVKVYENFEHLKLNDMVDITGILSVDPVLTNHTDAGDSSNGEIDLETITHNPPASLIPRIHALHLEKLQHCNPLIEHDFDKDLFLKEAKEARDHLHTALTQILFGDTLAADYLICHLISHVFARKDVLTLGKFALNLWHIPSLQYPNYTTQLYDIIKKVVTKSHYFPLTIDNLNDLNLLPKKDYECNRLTSGILQLSKSTRLILDETKMESGQLGSAGVANLATLGSLIQNQRLGYDFKFYKMEYECDIPVLILSEGKSLLPCEFSVPIKIDEKMLKISNETFEAANHYLNDAVLNKIRKYLSAVKLIEYQIVEEPQYIEEDFVNLRKEEGWNKEINEDDLHKLLVLTRFICLSRGLSTIDKECWDMAKNMEKERHIRRVNAQNK